MEEKDEIVVEDFLIDWASPLIYNIYHDEDDLLEDVNLSVNIVIFFFKRMISIMYLMKAQRVKYLSWVLNEVVLFIFL